MPSQRPRAAFEPISPELDVQALVDSTPNFEFVVRFHCDAIDEYGLEKFDELVWRHVVQAGKHSSWKGSMKGWTILYSPRTG